MGMLGDTANSIIDSVAGTNSGTKLSHFLAKFGSTAGKYVDLIDPLATFEANFKFYPNTESASDDSWYSKLGSALKSAVNTAATNALNNITGGLASSLMNNVDVKAKHDGFASAGTNSMMEYLAPANLVVGQDSWFGDITNAGQAAGSPLELNLGFYIQSITLPSISVQEDKANSVFGEVPIAGKVMAPDSHDITMDILNTKASLHERIFYPWMYETTLPYWSYDKQPYTTADITIDFSKHADLKYIFLGCRPKRIDLVKPTQRPDGETVRSVVFNFDFMIVQSNLQTVESLTSKLVTTGTTLLNAAAKTVNI